jgi:CRP/FNR family transcriptional regulator
MNLFAGLTHADFEVIEQRARLRTFVTGDTLIREGEQGDSLFVVRDGKVQIRKELGEGNYKRLKDLAPGDFFGELSFLDPSPRTATVVASSDGVLLELTEAEMDALAQERPDIAMTLYRNMLRELASRVKYSTEELKDASMWALEAFVA